MEDRLLAALAAEHERAPDKLGVERDRLRRLTQPALARPAFDTLLASPLADGRIAQTNAWLHLPEHHVQMRQLATATCGNAQTAARCRPLCAAPRP